MNDNMAKLISTLSVWTATAFIFVFGVFRFSSNGIGVFLWAMLALALVWAPVTATQAIWRAPTEPEQKNRSAQPEPAPTAAQKV